MSRCNTVCDGGRGGEWCARKRSRRVYVQACLVACAEDWPRSSFHGESGRAMAGWCVNDVRADRADMDRIELLHASILVMRLLPAATAAARRGAQAGAAMDMSTASLVPFCTLCCSFTQRLHTRFPPSTCETVRAPWRAFPTQVRSSRLKFTEKHNAYDTLRHPARKLRRAYHSTVDGGSAHLHACRVER